MAKPTADTEISLTGSGWAIAIRIKKEAQAKPDVPTQMKEAATAQPYLSSMSDLLDTANRKQKLLKKRPQK